MSLSMPWGLAGCALIGALVGCGAQTAEYPVTGTPVTLLVPRDLDGPQLPLSGVHLEPVRRVVSDSNDIQEFSAVDFPSAAPGTLSVRRCRGDEHDTGSVYQSCISFDALIHVIDEPEQRRLTVTPSRRREERGNDALFLPITMPRMSLQDWYYYVSHHTVRVRARIESPFPPEALKASFDRHLPQLEDEVADGATRQFEDVYAFGRGGNISTRVSIDYFPYQMGSLAEVEIAAVSRGEESSVTIDWTSHLRAVKQELVKIASD